MANILSLNDDLWNIILNYISVSNIGSLSSSHNIFYELFHQKLHTLYHECTDEIEVNWNLLVPAARERARFKLDKDMSSACYGWEVNKCREFQCSILKHTIHVIKVTYVYNPRDVDLLAWYLEDVKMGFTYL